MYETVRALLNRVSSILVPSCAVQNAASKDDTVAAFECSLQAFCPPPLGHACFRACRPFTRPVGHFNWNHVKRQFNLVTNQSHAAGKPEQICKRVINLAASGRPRNAIDQLNHALASNTCCWIIHARHQSRASCTRTTKQTDRSGAECDISKGPSR